MHGDDLALAAVVATSISRGPGAGQRVIVVSEPGRIGILRAGLIIRDGRIGVAGIAGCRRSRSRHCAAFHRNIGWHSGERGCSDVLHGNGLADGQGNIAGDVLGLPGAGDVVVSSAGTRSGDVSKADVWIGITMIRGRWCRE